MAWVPNREITSVSVAPQCGQRLPACLGLGRRPSVSRVPLTSSSGGMVATLLQPAQHVEGAAVDLARADATTAGVPGRPVDVQFGSPRAQALLEFRAKLGWAHRQHPLTV